MSKPIDHERDHPSTHHALQYAESESDLSLSDPEKQSPPEATRTVTQTTTTSSLTVESQNPQPKGDKPWYTQLNPFKSRRTFPVPKQRTVSREYGASFLSLLTFQWMAPLMKVVSREAGPVGVETDHHTRLDIRGHWN